MTRVAASILALGCIGLVASLYAVIWTDSAVWGRVAATSFVTLVFGGVLCWAVDDFEKWKARKGD